MSSVFPLLNSPRLVFSEIIDMLELHELVAMSLCSKKTNKKIKFNWMKPEQVKVLMTGTWFKNSVGYDYGEITKDLLSVQKKTNESAAADILKNLKMETVEIDGYKVPITIDTEGYPVTYWNDEKLGLMKVTVYVCHLFKTSINELFIGQEGLLTLNWVNHSWKKPVPNAYIHQSQTLTYEEYYKVLTECKVTDILEIHASPPELFRFPSNLLLPKVDCLVVTYGQWMTIDHLLSMNCKGVYIESTKFTTSEINKFIKNWLNGGCPQLEYLYIRTKNFANPFDVLNGVEFTRLDEKQIFKMRDGKPCTLMHSYDIKRSDGVTASISVNTNITAMFVKNN